MASCFKTYLTFEQSEHRQAFWTTVRQDLQTLALHFGQKAPVLNTTPKLWWHLAQTLPGVTVVVWLTLMAFDFFAVSSCFFRPLRYKIYII